jgi:WD40 repeat protein
VIAELEAFLSSHGEAPQLRKRLELLQLEAASAALAADLARLRQLAKEDPLAALVAVRELARREVWPGLEVEQQQGCAALLTSLEQQLLAILETRCADIEASLATGDLAKAEAAAASLQDQNLPRLAQRLALLRSTIAMAQRRQHEAAWLAALSGARDALANGSLESASDALAALEAEAAFMPWLTADPPAVELLELRCAARFIKARDAVLMARIEGREPIILELGGKQQPKIITGWQGAQLTLAGGGSAKLSQLGWSQQANWVSRTLATEGDRIVAIALRLAGVLDLSDAYLVRAVALGDPVALHYRQTRRIQPIAASELLQAEAAAPGALVGQALRAARAAAAERGRLLVDGYELTPAQFAAALEPSWSYELDQPAAAVAIDPRWDWVTVGCEQGAVALVERYAPRALHASSVRDGIRQLGADSLGRPLLVMAQQVLRYEQGQWTTAMLLTGRNTTTLQTDPSSRRHVLHGHDDRWLFTQEDATGRWGEQQLGAAGAFRSQVAWLPDGRLLQVDAAGSLSIWRDPSDHEPVQRSTTAIGPVAQLVVTPNGRFALTYQEPRSLRIWDLTDLTARDVVLPHNLEYCELALHPSGGLLAVAGRSGKVELYDVPNLTPLRRLRCYRGEPGKLHAVCFSDDALYTAGFDRRLRCFKVTIEGADPAAAIKVGASTLSPGLFCGSLATAWTHQHPDGVKRVASYVRGSVLSLCLDNQLRILRLSDGQVAKIAPPLAKVRDIAVDRQGTIHALAGLQIYRFDGSKWIAVLRKPHERPGTSLAFHSREPLVAWAEHDGSFTVYETRNWQIVASDRSTVRTCTALAWHPTLRRIAVDHANGATVFDLTPRGLERQWTAPLREVSLALGWGEDWLWACMHPQHLRAWSMAGEHQELLAERTVGIVDARPTAMAIHPSEHLVACGDSQGMLLIYDTRHWVEVYRQILVPAKPVLSLAWTPNGLLVGMENGMLIALAATPPALYSR